MGSTGFWMMVWTGLRSAFGRRERSVDPLDALYERLAAESEQVVNAEIERFKRTPDHGP